MPASRPRLPGVRGVLFRMEGCGMIALFIWLTGCVLLFWQMTARGYWHDLAAFLLGSLFVLWVIGGAALISSRMRARGVYKGIGNLKPSELQAAVARINAERQAREAASKGRESA
jgi:hypothetical protein